MLEPGFYNMDCMDGMREFPCGYFDLAIVDPPYGIGKQRISQGGGVLRQRAMNQFDTSWDTAPPPKNILRNCFALARTKSSAEETTLIFRRLVGLLCGLKNNPLITFLRPSTFGHRLTFQAKCLSSAPEQKERRSKKRFIRRRSLSHCMSFFSERSHTMATKSSTRTSVAQAH